MTFDGTTLSLVGNVDATSGTIGSWTIDSNYLYSTKTVDGVTTYTTIKGSGDVCFAVMSSSRDDTTGAPFQILHSGQVRIGVKTAEQIRMNDGEIHFTRADTDKGKLYLNGDRLTSSSEFGCDQSVFLANAKSVYGGKISGGYDSLIRLTAANNVNVGAADNAGDMYIYTSKNKSIFVYASTSDENGWSATFTNSWAKFPNAEVSGSTFLGHTYLRNACGFYGAKSSNGYDRMLTFSSSDNIVMGATDNVGDMYFYTKSAGKSMFYAGDKWSATFSSAGGKMSALDVTGSTTLAGTAISSLTVDGSLLVKNSADVTFLCETTIMSLNVTSSLDCGILTANSITANYNVSCVTLTESGGITGASGDQTGSEINIRGYYNYPWDYVLRLQNDVKYVYMYATHPDVNYRKSAGNAGKIRGQMRNGERVKILVGSDITKNGLVWVKTSYGNWIIKSLLKNSR